MCSRLIMSAQETTLLLQRLEAGDELAAGELFSRLYDEFREIAARLMRRERANHTLQPTALVNEAWMRLRLDPTLFMARTRGQFKAIAAGAMRRALVDYARGRAAEKRGGGRRRITIGDLQGESEFEAVEVLSLDDAIEALAANDERQSRIVVLRFYAGMTEQEIAEALDVSVGTVKGDWRHARAFLKRRMSA
jgi:RNA polymerase sigma factor (TIGR02999 family)